MANDRIWIRCTTCDKRTLLTKHYPACGLEELWCTFGHYEYFMMEHLAHHPNQGKMHLDGVTGLVFETDDAPSGKLAKEIMDAVEA